MQKPDEAVDYSGRPVKRGDTVATINGQLTARVCDIANNGETVFVRLRPLHQPYGKGTWHAADRLIWVAAATRRKRRGKDDDSDGASQEETAGATGSSRSSDTADTAGSDRAHKQ